MTFDRARLACVAWVALSVACAVDPRQPCALHERLQACVAAHIAERGIPGACVAVVSMDGSVRYIVEGLADVGAQVPVEVDTVFEIASLTKQFTAAAVLMLVDEGALSLQDPISKFVEGAPAAWREIRIHHLLEHTAGLPGEDGQFASLAGRWPRRASREVMLESALLDRLEGIPGARFRYSSVDYFLAAIAVERASGMSFRRFLAERIFAPLQLRRTYLQDEERIVEREARGYAMRDGRLVNICRDAEEEVAGGWGMFSCAPDLVRWDRAVRDGELLTEESWRRMFTPLRLLDGSSFRYGLGWWLPERNGVPYQYHDGITGTEILRVPSRGITVIALMNLGHNAARGAVDGDPWGLADRLVRIMLPAFVPRVVDLPRSIEQLSEYVGSWRFPDGPVRLFIRDGHLWVHDAAGEDRLRPCGEDRFGIAGTGTELRFARDGRGRITTASWVGETFASEGQRVR